MPRTSASESLHNASSGRQTANPRRSARLQNSVSARLDHAPVDQFSQKNITDSQSLEPSTTKGTRKRQPAEKAARIEQHTAPKREQSPDAGPAKRRRRPGDAGQSAEDSLFPPSEQDSAKKRKRSQDAETSPSASHQRLDAQQSPNPEPTSANTPHSSSPGLGHEEQPTDPVDYWRKHLVWPSNFFESDRPVTMSRVTRSESTRKKDRRNYSQEDISDSESESSETRALLRQNDVFQMFLKKQSREPVGGLPDEAEKLVRRLKTQEQSVPPFFDERTLELVASKTEGKNEAKVVQDVGPFVVPHVDHLNYLEHNSLEHLTESVDETWSHCIPICGPSVPKPDYSAGFCWSRFNDSQLMAIAMLGPNLACSFSRGANEQYFPFFTCEAKGTSGDMSEGRNQSLETALIASRGLIELFKRTGLEDKVQRQILCFSALYDNRTVEIYAHLAHDVRERFPTFYRYQVASFGFPGDGWASYKLVKNIYTIWAPMHGDLICEALNALAKTAGMHASSSSSSSPPAVPSVTSGPRNSNGGSMGPPPRPEPADRSGRSRSRNDLTPDKPSPNAHTKKPKTSG